MKYNQIKMSLLCFVNDPDDLLRLVTKYSY